MEFKIASKIKLLSINAAYTTLRNGKRRRSNEYKTFAIKIRNIMLFNKKQFMEFDDYFNPKKHFIHGQLIFYTPTFYTARGAISKKSGDLGNVEKCLTDNVLTRKVDDSAIVVWAMEKRPSDVYAFEYTLTIKDIRGE